MKSFGDIFKLDNAANLYPAVSDTQWSSSYRVSVVLKERVKPEILQKAVDDVLPRFPSFCVCIRKGIFWYYLEELNKPFVVKHENDYPCAKFAINLRDYLFRVYYYKNRISFESFHAITDGFGGLLFLNTLLYRYFELCGVKITDKTNVLHYKDNPQLEEVEDSFLRCATKKAAASRKEAKAYHVTGTKELPGILNVMHGVMSASQANAVAKSKGVTLTQYFVAAIVLALYRRQKYENKSKAEVKVSVPVNLRGMFASRTLRNFSAFVNVGIRPTQQEDFTFDEILQSVRTQLKEGLTKENLEKNINANVNAQKNFLIRILPLELKKIGLRLSFAWWGESRYTTVLSNLGNIAAPMEFREKIHRYECLLGAQKNNNIAFTACSFNDQLVLSITRTIKENFVEREFFKILSEDGIQLKLEENRREE